MVIRVLNRWTILPGLICVMAAAGACEPRGLDPQGEFAYAESGPFSVQGVESLTLADRQRGTDVLVRVYYPNGDGPFPVIAFSHSVNGTKDLFGAISTHWASHGYVVVHPTHDDTGVRMGPDGMQPPAEKVRERLGDVTAVLDALDQIESRIPDLQGKLDPSRLAVAGHSYGSFITMVSGGVTINIGQELNANLGDTRVRCILPISPSGRGDYGMNDASWDNLTIPALFITGTADRREGRHEEWRMEPYEFSPAGDKYQMVINDAAHSSFGGDRPDGDAPTYVKAASTAFWDFCVNGAGQGKTWLENGFLDFADGAATLAFK